MTYPIRHFASRHRAFLKIQDGCDAGCTYCIVPQLRPNLASLPPEKALAQAQAFIAAGHREIVLSGVFLGAYENSTTRLSRGRNPRPLVELVRRLLDLPGLGRLRLSSLEPGDLTEDLLAVVAASPRFAAHLHLPLQSGSDRILRKMGRQYRAAEYLAAVERARASIDRLALTTDVIVGFPGEADEDFAATLQMAGSVGFAKIHVFPFSPREGTPANRWRNEMPSAGTVRDRLASLRRLERELARDFRRSFLGRSVRVLVEKAESGPDNGRCTGRADQYFPVHFPGEPGLDGQLIDVLVRHVKPDSLAVEGELVGRAGE